MQNLSKSLQQSLRVSLLVAARCTSRREQSSHLGSKSGTNGKHSESCFLVQKDQDYTGHLPGELKGLNAAPNLLFKAGAVCIAMLLPLKSTQNNALKGKSVESLDSRLGCLLGSTTAFRYHEEELQLELQLVNTGAADAKRGASDIAKAAPRRIGALPSMSQTKVKHVVSHWERSPPLAVLAAAEIARVTIELNADPKFSKDSLPILHLGASRYVQS